MRRKKIILSGVSYLVIGEGNPLLKEYEINLDDGDGKDPKTQTIVKLMEGDKLLVIREQKDYNNTNGRKKTQGKRKKNPK